MRVGGMRHRITVSEKTGTRNEYGEVVWAWSDVKTIRAQVTKAGGSQSLSRDEVFNTETIKIQVWGHTGITEQNRIKWRGQFYSIDFIEPSYDDRVTVLNCNKIND